MVACDGYEWLDSGKSVQLTLLLPDDIPAALVHGAIECDFQRSALCVTMTAGAAAQHVLRVQSLYAPVLPDRCSWRLHNGANFPKRAADASHAPAMVGAIVVAGTKPWAVRITLHKEDPSVPWSTLVTECPLQR